MSWIVSQMRRMRVSRSTSTQPETCLNFALGIAQDGIPLEGVENLLDDLLRAAIAPRLAFGQVLCGGLANEVGAVVRDGALRTGRKNRRQTQRSNLKRTRYEMQGPDGSHERRRLGNDDLYYRAGFFPAERQVVNPGKMHNHTDVNKRGREQVGNGHRVKGNRDALADTIGSHELIANFSPGRKNSAAYLVGQVSSKQAGIKRRQRLAFRLKYFPELEPQHGHIGLTWTFDRHFLAGSINLDDRLGARLCRGDDDILRINEAGCFAAYRSNQGSAFGDCIQISFIQYHDDRPALHQYGPQRVKFCLSDVAVERKDNQIRSTRHFPGKHLTIFTTCLVEARRINQKYTANLLFVPGLHARVTRSPMDRADGE